MCVRGGKILMIKESSSLSGNWELPGGGLDFGEDVNEAFKREVEEEMGLKVTKMSEAPIYTWTWKYENRRGIDWFYSCVLAYRVEFADLAITPSKECEAVEFFSLEKLKDLPLGGQMTPLTNFFNPKDFENQF